MTEVMQVREAYRVEPWRQLMQQRKNSPLNNREFCAQQGISEKSDYYWLKKLRESAMERGIPQLVALEDREKPDELRIEYHGASMVLPGYVDIDAVAAVLRSRCSKHDRPESGREILCGLRLYGYAPGHRRSCRHRVTAIRGATV